MSRVTNYFLWGCGVNVLQPSYNDLFIHDSFSYIIAHIWNVKEIQLLPIDTVWSTKKNIFLNSD